MSNENVLIFNYKTSENFATLVQNDKVTKTITLPSPDGKIYGDHFPRQAIRIALGLEEDPKQIIFLGKPLLYMEKLLKIHSCFFPFYPIRFYFDFFDLLSNSFQIDQLTHNIILDRSTKHRHHSVNKKQENRRISFNYVSVSDALAVHYQQQNKKYKTILVCLTDDYNGPSFTYYKIDEDKIQTKHEEQTTLGIGHFCQLYQNISTKTDIDILVKTKSNGQLIFNKKLLEPQGLYLNLKKQTHFTNEKDNSDFFIQVFSNALDTLICTQPLLILYDFEIPQKLPEIHSQITFKKINLQTKMSSAHLFCKYYSKKF